jgi:hypothetical protein
VPPRELPFPAQICAKFSFFRLARARALSDSIFAVRCLAPFLTSISVARARGCSDPAFAPSISGAPFSPSLVVVHRIRVFTSVAMAGVLCATLVRSHRSEGSFFWGLCLQLLARLGGSQGSVCCSVHAVLRAQIWPLVSLRFELVHFGGESDSLRACACA